MTDDHDFRAAELEALERLLASCGSDRTRWPAPERLRFAPLLAASGEAQRLLKEAAALDRVMDFAPRPSRARAEALAERIVAAATAESEGGLGRHRAARALRRVLSPAPIGMASLARRTATASMRWPAAALLAASLAIGAFAGTEGLFEAAIEPLAVAVGPDSEAEADASHLAFGDERAGLLEEDLL